MKNLKDIARTRKKDLFFLFIIALIIAITVVAQGYFLVKSVDAIFLQDKTVIDVLPLLGGLLAVMFIRTLLNHMKSRKGINMASAVKRLFRRKLLDQYANNPVHLAQQGQTGQKVSMMMDAVDEVDSYFSNYIPQVMVTTIVPLLLLLVVFTQHVNSGIIMIITAPFIPVFMVIIGMKTKQKSEEQMEKLGSFSGRFLDALQGLVTLKLFNQEKKQKDIIRKSSNRFRDATMELLKVAFQSSFMLEVVTMLSIGIVALELAIQLIVYENLSFFTAFFIFVLVPEFFTSLKQLGTTFHNGRTSMGAAQKIMNELAGVPDAVNWGTDQIKSQEPPIIELHQVGFHYEKGKFSLDSINATIPSQSQIAIVGKSGSGKTTLLHLIAGLIQPSEGKLLVNGRPLTDYQEKEWFHHLAYITQNPYIFSGTIAENIAIGGPKDATRDEIVNAAKQAGLDEMIETLEFGYDTKIGESARGLSGGEKQRLAVARAFLKRPSIILFDEPTTGLDLQTEQVLQASMEQLRQQSTVITVAHRLHTIKNADSILLLDHGRLIAAGSHEELLANNSIYEEMVSIRRGGGAE